jgi:hypothetical protein
MSKAHQEEFYICEESWNIWLMVSAGRESGSRGRPTQLAIRGNLTSLEEPFGADPRGFTFSSEYFVLKGSMTDISSPARAGLRRARPFDRCYIPASAAIRGPGYRFYRGAGPPSCNALLLCIVRLSKDMRELWMRLQLA